MFGKKKPKISAVQCADCLLNGLVANAWSAFPPLIKVRQPAHRALEGKTGLFALAAVLVALRQQEQIDPKLNQVRVEIERRVFGTAETASGLQTLELVQRGMKSLKVLADPSGRNNELSWSSEWLLEIGIDEANSASLALLAVFWMDYQVEVSKAFGRFEII